MRSAHVVSRWRPLSRAVPLAVLLVMPTGCARLLRPKPVHPETSVQDARVRNLEWALGGTRLLVDGRWLLDPATGAFSPLPYATRQAHENGGYLEFQTALSPTGVHIVVSDGETLRQGPVSGPLEPSLDLPSFPSSGDAASLQSAVFWLSEDRLGVYQADVNTGGGPWCSVLDLRQQEGWRRVSECPPSGFLHLGSVHSGPEGWLVLFSGGEGVPGVDVARYAPEGATESVTHALGFNLYPGEPLNAQFALEGVRLHLATPCVLERSEPSPCAELEAQAPWHLYSWSGPGDSPLVPRHELTPDSVPHPSGERWAWPEAGRICVAGSSSPTACFPLPGPR